MSLNLTTLPTMRDLLADEVYAEYFEKTPKLTNRGGQPWRVLAKRHNAGPDKVRKPYKYGMADFERYRDARDKVVSLLLEPRNIDVALISKRRLMMPPVGFEWDSAWHWCTRCRRPSEFRLTWSRPPALKDAPAITFDEPVRCVFCGVRASFAKPITKPRMS
jgi:hypothetical protein